MGNVFFISDTHFSHAKLLTFESSSRGKRFSSVEEMNQVMEDNWNKVVTSKDVVYHLGDVTFGNHEVLKRLKGDKKLILGNHDKFSQIKFHFSNIFGALKYKYKDMKIILTHFPINVQSLGNRFTHNMHGHMHDHVVLSYPDEYSVSQEIFPDKRFVNVAVEQIDYSPISLEDLYERARY